MSEIVMTLKGKEELEKELEGLIKVDRENIKTAIAEAREYDDQVELGDQLQIEHTLEDYGRTGASQLHREIEYHIQRLVEDEAVKIAK